MNSAVRLILGIVAREYGWSINDLLGKSRISEIVHARHCAFYVARMRTDLSYPALGRDFNRDHATVYHGVKQHRARLTKGRDGGLTKSVLAQYDTARAHYIGALHEQFPEAS